MKIWTSGPYRLLAVDGTDVHQPTEISGRSVTLTAGGRADLEVQVPTDGTAVRVQLSKATAVIIGATGRRCAGAAATCRGAGPAELRLTSPARLRPNPPHPPIRLPDRPPTRLRQRPPGMWWSINGRLFPHVPMYVVREGDVVVMHIENHSGEVHPMHLHGHHEVVLARNGVAASGSPWWVDSLNVLPGETYDIAFVANNPGIWMDHCHNLKHAAQGMIAHLMYEGFDTPYRIAGQADNQPE